MNSAPVNGATNGTLCFSTCGRAGMLKVALAYPNTASKPFSSIRTLPFSPERSASLASSMVISSSLRLFMPPAALTVPKEASAPSRMPSPNSLLAPESGPDCPIRIVVLVTPCAWAEPAASKHAANNPIAIRNLRLSFIGFPPRSLPWEVSRPWDLDPSCLIDEPHRIIILSGNAVAAQPALLKELAAAADHRQVDIFRAAVVGRREADHEFAEIYVVHAFKRRDQLFAGQVLACALQALHHYLSDDESLQARKIEVRVARLRHDLLVLLHDADAARGPGEGHDLRNRDSVAFVLQGIGERLAADEGHIVELSDAPRFFHLPHELCDRGVSRDHDHAAGPGRVDGFDRIFHLDRVALHFAEGGNLQIALGHGYFHALQARQPVVVVLVEHRDIRIAVGDQQVDDLLGFVVIAGAHVEDVAIDRGAQQLRAGKGSDQRHLGVGYDGHGRRGRRGADVGDQGEYLVLLYQFRGGVGAQIRFVLVVASLERDLPSVNTASRIDMVQVRFGADVHLDTELGGGAGKCRRLSEQNGFGRDTRHLPERREAEQSRERGQVDTHRSVLH